jgi:hypothetical protein
VSIDEWDQRELCSDGACIGTIGSDGSCKVCGRAAQNWGNERARGLQEEPVDAAEDNTPDEDELEEQAEQLAAEVNWDDRKLCDDGACVGVIGKDGVCTVCGTRSKVA